MEGLGELCESIGREEAYSVDGKKFTGLNLATIVGRPINNNKIFGQMDFGPELTSFNYTFNLHEKSSELQPQREKKLFRID